MSHSRDVIWLSEADVAALFTIEDALSVVQEAFRLYGEGQVQMPTKMYLDFSEYQGDLRTMPAYVKGKYNAAGVKIVNSHPLNPQKNLPAVTGIMILNDPQTGLPLAVMAAGVLTSLRTGAGGGVAAKYLARPNSSVVGLVGCGRQAHTQLKALLSNFKIKEVRVWGQTPKESERFCSDFSGPFSLNPCDDIASACQADIVVTTTPVHTPIIKKDYIRPGTHINAIGADAPGKQELETDLLQGAFVFVDDKAQAAHAGEINVALAQKKVSLEDIKGTLGDVVCGKTPGRRDPQEITIFDSTGLALQDVASAKMIYDKAIQSKKGQRLNFYG